MGVQLYRVEPFEHPQENAAFDLLCRAVRTYLGDHEDVRVIGNVKFPGGQMDVLVLARRSITVIDFKEWGGTITVGRRRPWRNQDGATILGGSYANPFLQVAAYRQTLQNALVGSELAGNDFAHINGLVIFTKAVELIEDPDDSFGPFVEKWFQVHDWDGAIRVLRSAASPAIDLPPSILDRLVSELKAITFAPMTGEKLVPARAITDALMEQDIARMIEWETEHRDEMRAQYEKAQEGWDRMDFPKRK